MNEYNTTDQRYQKMWAVMQRFVAFQVGICTFTWNSEQAKYNYRPFSFYVWPKSKLTDWTMMFQQGSVDFLVAHNFDFNKLFDKGITYARYKDI